MPGLPRMSSPRTTRYTNRQLQLFKVLALATCRNTAAHPSRHRRAPRPPHKEDAKRTSTRHATSAHLSNFPAGSFVIRMDQPFSRIADALLTASSGRPTTRRRNPMTNRLVVRRSL